ncbi:hypothetical protein PNOK_0070400 [Pyrrhoderma noxium]|uniref:Uncharacterized protein n=1 Tax=Pyrrhoderma noxium TaxID=2282107 RepID=A0A286UVL2_9AGAM|nr:hypothetical protein PNOK_0070400 [Pyrrhoderma noxium]
MSASPTTAQDPAKQTDNEGGGSHSDQGQPVQKRGRGRPKGSKNKSKPEGNVPAAASGEPGRKRGRPRKVPDNEQPKAKKPRGRPKKQGTTNATKPGANDEDDVEDQQPVKKRSRTTT